MPRQKQPQSTTEEQLSRLRPQPATSGPTALPPGTLTTLAALPSTQLRRQAAKTYAQHHGNRAFNQNRVNNTVQRGALQDRIDDQQQTNTSQQTNAGQQNHSGGNALSQAIFGGRSQGTGLPGIPPVPIPPIPNLPSIPGFQLPGQGPGTQPGANPPAGGGSAPGTQPPSAATAGAAESLGQAGNELQAAVSYFDRAMLRFWAEDNEGGQLNLDAAFIALDVALGLTTEGHQMYLVTNSDQGGAVQKKEIIQRSAWDWITGSDGETSQAAEPTTDPGTTQHDQSSDSDSGITDTPPANASMAAAAERSAAALGSSLSARADALMYNAMAGSDILSDAEAATYYNRIVEAINRAYTAGATAKAHAAVDQTNAALG